MKIAITGKIGAGKSSLARSLAELLTPCGYVLVDIDSLTDRLHQDPEFSENALRLFGTCERQEISRACFLDPAKLEALEEASGPSWVRLLTQSLTSCSKLIVDFPLLLETQLACSDMDLCVGVSAPDAVREKRACARLGWDRERFARVDARQIGQRTKMAFCDVEISNDATPEELKASASRLARHIRAMDDIEPFCAPVIGPIAFREVFRAYAQPHRRYHGGAHLKALFDHIDPAFKADPACVMAIAYHDFVYDVGEAYGSNETLSTRALSRQARDLFPKNLVFPEHNSASAQGAVALACAMIDATQGHCILDPWISEHPGRLARAQAFLDADLSIFGSTEEACTQYDRDIGEEFSKVERPLYHRLRAQSLSGFLNPALRPRIYLTERCSVWEALARERLASLVSHHELLARHHTPPFAPSA